MVIFLILCKGRRRLEYAPGPNSLQSFSPQAQQISLVPSETTHAGTWEDFELVHTCEINSKRLHCNQDMS